MRKRRWLVAASLCAQSGLAVGPDSAQPPATDPQEKNLSAPAPAQSQAPAGQPADRAIYPSPPPDSGSSAPSYSSTGVPGASDGSVTARYGTDPYAGNPGVLDVVPETNPYHLSTRQKYPLRVDFQLEVPIPLTDDHDSSKVGFGASIWAGWNLGFLVPTANMGWSWAELN